MFEYGWELRVPLIPENDFQGLNPPSFEQLHLSWTIHRTVWWSITFPVRIPRQTMSKALLRCRCLLMPELDPNISFDSLTASSTVVDRLWTGYLGYLKSFWRYHIISMSSVAPSISDLWERCTNAVSRLGARRRGLLCFTISCTIHGCLNSSTSPNSFSLPIEHLYFACNSPLILSIGRFG